MIKKHNILFYVLQLLVLFLTLSTTSLFAQNLKPFPKSVSNSLQLDTGSYIVHGTNIIEKDAFLKITSGCKLIFDENAVIQIKGGIALQGDANDFVEVTSLDNKKPGLGFVIQFESDQPVLFDYVDFHDMKKSIKLDRYWLRKDITISHCMFRNHQHGVYLEILEADKLMQSQPVQIAIFNNTFANNNGSVMLTDVAWQDMDMFVTHNVISANTFVGRNYNGVFTTPFFMNFNKTIDEEQPTFQENSINYNAMGLIESDSVSIQPVYMTVVGSASKMDVSGNYYGDQYQTYLTKQSQAIQSLQRAPELKINDVLSEPVSRCNGHFYEVAINEVKQEFPYLDLVVDEETKSIILTGNQSAIPTPDYDVVYFYIEGDTIRKHILSTELNLVTEENQVEISIHDDFIALHPGGYLEINGFKDKNGFLFPKLSIGFHHYLNENRDFLYNVSNYQNIPVTKTKNDTVEVIDNQQNDVVKKTDDIDLVRKFWAFQVSTSSTAYFGDLVASSVAVYLPNARPQLGFAMSYHFNPKLAIVFNQNSLILTGDDSRESIVGKARGTNYERGLSFRTTVFDLGVHLNYRPFKYTTLGSIIPSIQVGFSGYYFNPQAKYNGQYYDLRPIGTEGQTIDGQDNTYGKFSYAIPVGIHVERHISQRFIVGMQWTYHKLFTDYLDDVSTGTYPDRDKLILANPDIGEAAAVLSNPNNQTGQRSYSDNYDGFGYFGLTFTWKM